MLYVNLSHLLLAGGNKITLNVTFLGRNTWACCNDTASLSTEYMIHFFPSISHFSSQPFALAPDTV